ncbi:MAG: hypothetical protein LBS31_02230, partial [Candidatus Adiutrix sp.]|nr:hypothetical protein [Candidatus Adiutrix sp.]
MVGKKNFGRREVEYGRAASPGKPGPPAKPVPAPLFDWRRVRPAAIAVFGCFISLSVIGGLTWYFFPQTEHLLLMASFGSSA